ncbi:hypothetical protein BVG80_11440 [Sphingobacteriales bacterium TSM_CSM]|nr:hypothetical protein BVG80_11440 [Sphingobacteriales bacterium TSM_CSM]
MVSGPSFTITPVVVGGAACVVVSLLPVPVVGVAEAGFSAGLGAAVAGLAAVYWFSCWLGGGSFF